MSKSFDDLIYDSGLIASGCWEELDTYTQEAIERLFQMTVLKCAEIGERYADGNYEVRNQILEHFGLEEE